MQSLKAAFSKLPPKAQVFLVQLASAFATAASAAAWENLQPIISGTVPISRASLVGVVVAALFAGWAAGKLFAIQSPLPREVWSEAQRKAARLAEEAEAKLKALEVEAEKKAE